MYKFLIKKLKHILLVFTFRFKQKGKGKRKGGGFRGKENRIISFFFPSLSPTK